MSSVEQRQLKQRLKVRIHGVDALDLPWDTFDSSPGDVVIGRNPTGALVGPAFTGEILDVQRRPVALPPAVPETTGPVRIIARFPAAPTQPHQPLLTTGKTGAGDVLFASFIGPNRIRLARDHWGYPPVTGPELTIDPSRRYLIDIWLGSLAGPTSDTVPAWVSSALPTNSSLRDSLVGRVDGVVVWATTTAAYPARNFVFVGQNPIHATSCAAQFEGVVEGWHRLGRWDTPAAFSIYTALPEPDDEGVEVVLAEAKSAPLRLLARYSAEGVAFGWSSGSAVPAFGPPVRYDAHAIQKLHVALQSDAWKVSLNGTEVLRTIPFAAAPLGSPFTFVGRPSASSGDPRPFSGRVFAVVPDPEPAP